MIDLHIHSTHSDGTDTTIELLKKAEKLGLEIISITDHDKVDAHLELENVNITDYYNGILIKGVEFKSVYKSVPIEILAYGIDARKIKKTIIDKMKSQDKKQEKKLAHLKRIGKSIGLKFDDNIQIDEEHIYASLTFSREIFKYAENTKIMQKYDLGTDETLFYRKAQSNPNSVFYVDESEEVIPPEQIIKEIHNAGGFAFMAHPLLYPFKNKFETIEEFVKEHSIDGLECYYPLFSAEEREKLVEICRKYNLYKSGGSDYHGLNKPGINMGTGKDNLNISRELVNDWIRKLI